MIPILLMYWSKIPDEHIYRLALDIAHVPAEEVAYIEDPPVFGRVAVCIIYTDEEWMIANTVCRVPNVATK